jgi:glycosyltransferase involved in cell wall biosynthesis
LLAARAPNVEWVPWLQYERLPDAYRSAAFALGVFGRSEKTLRIIPNKAFQALACGTPLVTADTPAARELLVDGESALLVPPGDADALAGALQRVAGDDALRRRLAAGGLSAYREHASEAVLGRRWRELLQSA